MYVYICMYVHMYEIYDITISLFLKIYFSLDRKIDR